MSKIISYTPAWLSKGEPGHTIFTSNATTTPPTAVSTGHDSSSKRAAKPGPRRAIARRGTEVFVAVGKEIRWADLAYLNEAYEHKESRKSRGKRKQSEDSQYDADHAQGYRVGLRSLYVGFLLIFTDD